MSSRQGFGAWSVGRRVAYGYAAAGIILLAALAVHSASADVWLWRAVLLVLFLVVSLRSALIWSYRRTPSRLSWWLRPSPGAEREFTVMWLVYAVAFGACPLLLFLI